MNSLAELRACLHGDQSREAAKETLRGVMHNGNLSRPVRLAAAMALVELRGGRSVVSVMARLRREIGLDRKTAAEVRHDAR
jgi:hypothetical protein